MAISNPAKIDPITDTKRVLIKLLGAAATSGTVLASIAMLPHPWDKVAAGILAAIGGYVNWASHPRAVDPVDPNPVG